ncbi:MAG: ABC transporter ATP-binding protein [Thermodesulfobacteriota bacterium]
MMKLSRWSVAYRDGDHDLLALDRVDLSLEPGRIVALVGESGSGKTTLARSLLGLLPPNARVTGSLGLGARALGGLPEADWRGLRWTQVSLVFQHGAASLNPLHAVIDQVAEPLVEHLGLGRREAAHRAGAALQALGLDLSLARRFPHELSGGQVQRALLAMALILDPAVVVLDEPTAALDAVTKRFVAGVIRGLRDRGKAILLITHDLEVARTLADEVAVLYLGQVVETLSAADLLCRPRHPYTLALGRSYPALDAVRDLGGIRGDAFYRLVHAHGRNDGPPHTHGSAPGITPEPGHETGHGPAQGCLFEPRCTQALPACAEQEVFLVPAGAHAVRCLRGGIADLVALVQVGKTYGPVTALAPQDLTLRCGEVFCLVGETGSGKSTLALIAAGALRPDGGSRSFAGRDLDAWLATDPRGLARRIGVIYQNPGQAVSHRLNAFEIVAEPLRIQAGRRDPEELRRRVVQALAEVHLPTRPEFLGRYPHELNQGALQRLCIARALITEPALVVADEPTSALDPGVQAKVLKRLLDLQIEKGLTLLLVTHDLGLARKVSDRIGVMDRGRLVEIGPAAHVLAHPEHPCTRQLLASAGA